MMNNKMRKLLGISLALIIALSASAIPALAADASGSAGITWLPATEISVSVTYRGGEGSNGAEPVDSKNPYAPGAAVTALGQGFLTRENHIFAGWTYSSAEPTVFNDGTPLSNGMTVPANSVFVMPEANVTLTARWTEQPGEPGKAETYTVEFDRNDGEASSRAFINGIPSGMSIRSLGRQLPVFTRAGYTFSGWNTRADGKGTVFTDTTIVSNAVRVGTTLVVYAQWSANNVEPPVTPPTTPPTPETPQPPTPPVTPPGPGPTPSPAPSTTQPTTPAPVSPATPIRSPTEAADPIATPVPDMAPIPATDVPMSGGREPQQLPPNRDVVAPGTQIPFIGPDAPFLRFGDRNVPLFAPQGTDSWALVNLIITVMGLTLSIMVTVNAIIRKRRQQRDEEPDAAQLKAQGKGKQTDKEPDTRNPEEQNKQNRLVLLTLAIASGIVHTLLFILTQDMTKLMALIDWWTLVHVIIFAAEIVAIVLMRKRRNNEGNMEDDTQTQVAKA